MYEITLRCIDCGEEWSLDCDGYLAVGDYLENYCPMCETETEHQVVKVQSLEGQNDGQRST